MDISIQHLLSVVALFGASYAFDDGYSKTNNRFSEIVLPFEDTRKFRVETDPSSHSFTITFKNTSPDELEELYQYDDAVIKRLLIKDLGADGAVVTVFLRDRQLRSSVFALEEPFRLVINIFDRGFQTPIDPATGLPTFPQTKVANSASGAREGQTFSEHPSMDDLPRRPALAGRTRKKSEHPGQRRLLQPSPQLGDTPREWERRLAALKAGRGPAWKGFPIYIYPIQTATFEGRKNPGGWQKSLHEESMTKGQQIASYALKLYSFSDEHRALKAYQQVLHIEPKVFEKDPLHLWAFAESHLGQGNLTLADGYYRTLISRFPQTRIAQLARLRRLDMAAIRALRTTNESGYKELVDKLGKMPEREGAEFRSQQTIRQVYWSNPAFQKTKNQPPPINDSQFKILRALHEQIESRKTAFISYSLMLNKKMDKAQDWQPSISQFADRYFRLYRDQKELPYYAYLRSSFDKNFSQNVVKFAKNKRFSDVVVNVESLTPELLPITKSDPEVAWAVAEAYRESGQFESAIRYYGHAVSHMNDSHQKLRGTFWISYLATKEADDRQGNAIAQSLKTKARSADRRALRIWAKLPAKDKENLQATYKKHFEASLVHPNNLRAPAIILLAAWDDALSTKMEATSATDKEARAGAYSPSAQTVKTLDMLAKRFARLGMATQRRRALGLMRKLSAKDMEDDKAAKATWYKNLLSFADELRVSNELVEAGRIYTFAARSGETWEKKAEALYKGGLLLYKAGKREEAVQAFEQASQDPNNLFYANLAKERLTQLNR